MILNSHFAQNVKICTISIKIQDYAYQYRILTASHLMESKIHVFLAAPIIILLIVTILIIVVFHFVKLQTQPTHKKVVLSVKQVIILQK